MKTKFYVIITKDAQKIYAHHPATRYGAARDSISSIPNPENLIDALERYKDYCKFLSVESAKVELLKFIKDKSTYKASDFAILPVEMEIKTTISPYITIEDPDAKAKELLNLQRKLCKKELRKIRREYLNRPMTYVQHWTSYLKPEVVDRVKEFSNQFGGNAEALQTYMLNRLYKTERHW